MAKQTVYVSSGGIGFFGLLAILFIALKLCNVIAWSWWWVLAPIWIPLLISIGIFGIVLVIGLLAAICSALLFTR